MKKHPHIGKVKGRRRAQKARYAVCVSVGSTDAAAKAARRFKTHSSCVGSPARQPVKRGRVLVVARAFADFPAGSRARALVRKLALRAYFIAVANGKAKSTAERQARSIVLRETGKAVVGKTIRRWLQRVHDFGGFTKAPNEAYLDNKSCPHKRARKNARLNKRKRSRR